MNLTSIVQCDCTMQSVWRSARDPIKLQGIKLVVVQTISKITTNSVYFFIPMIAYNAVEQN